MKSLQQYISEQMVCELSSALLKRAANKAKGSRKQKFEFAAWKASVRDKYNQERYKPILREKCQEIVKLMDKGFKFDLYDINDNDFESNEWVLVPFTNSKTPDLIFALWLYEFRLSSFEIYKESISDQDPILEYNGKVVYHKTLQDRREVKAIVDFANAFDIKIDKNELIA